MTDSSVTPIDTGEDSSSETGQTDTSPKDTGDTPIPKIEDVTVATSGVITCASPEDRDVQPFDTVLSLSPPQKEETNLIGGGLVSGDFNDDGHLDILIPRASQTTLLMGTGSGEYSSLALSDFTNLSELLDVVGGSAIDVEGDGDLDIFLTRYGAYNRLLLNDGTGMFTDHSIPSGFSSLGSMSVSSSWGDMDQDGDLDLVVGAYGPHPEDPLKTELILGDPSELWENKGGGLFENISHLLPPEVHEAHVFTTSWIDINGDHYPELFTIHDYGWARPSRLLWNQEGTLVLDDGSANFHPNFAGMGLGVGDLNGDEFPDFIQTSWRTLSLLKSQATTEASHGVSWFEYAAADGLVLANEELQEFGWGVEFGDVDNDMDLDAVTLFGGWEDWPGIVMDQPDALYILESDGQWVDRAAQWGVDDTGSGRSIIVADFNNDGWLDLLKRQLNGDTRLYQARCGVQSWMRIRLHSPPPNTSAVGAHIRITQGEHSWIRWIHSGSTGLFTGSPIEAHFGLGQYENVEKVEVFWPNGTVSVFNDLATRQILDITLLDSTSSP